MQYLILTLKHKIYVYRIGRLLGLGRLQLLLHDWTKLTPMELPHYQRQFFGDKGDPAGFIKAWTHHQNSNRHHWEYWIPRTGHNRCDPPYLDNVPIQMPEKYVREMIADWMGAGKAYNGAWPNPWDWKWFENSWHSIRERLHPDTQHLVLKIVDELGELMNKEEQYG